MRSEAERIALQGPAYIRAYLEKHSLEALGRQFADWHFTRRPEQIPPSGDWRVWLIQAGRGFGKSRTGAEWVRERAEADGGLRIALVGATLNEARQIMVEGESGLMAIGHDDARPKFEPSLRRITWPNGAMATLYSAAEPESLRGPQHDIAWCDEIGKWEDGIAAWDMLSLTMRIGDTPQIVATTTPRPTALFRRLLNAPGVHVTRGASEDNRANVAAIWLETMRQTYAGTRLGRQELDGELIDQIEGALWNRDWIEAHRVEAAPELRRVVIGVDPPAGVGGDACGIVVVGTCAQGRAYVIADESVSGKTPEGWARAVANAADLWRADRVVAEANNGGKMVESVLQGAGVALPLTLVHAAVGKSARAEPVAALYERGQVSHVGGFPALEDELCGYVAGGGYEGPGRSPDRGDALVWAMKELMLGKIRAEPRVRFL